MEKAIKQLAKSKLINYIAAVFYLVFILLAALGDEWPSLICLVIAIGLAVTSIVFEIRFTYGALKK